MDNYSTSPLRSKPTLQLKACNRLLTTIVGKSLNGMRSIGVRGWFLFRVFLAGALLIQAQQAFSCSLAVGYFHQVTRLRGIVVGTGNYWPLLGYRSYPAG